MKEPNQNLKEKRNSKEMTIVTAKHLIVHMMTHMTKKWKRMVAATINMITPS